MRSISYPLLFPLLAFLIFFGPPILGRYMWVMIWSPSAWPVFFDVIFGLYGCQLASIWNAFITILYTPWVILYKYALLFVDFLQLFFYNWWYLFNAVWLSLQFSERGVVFAIQRIWGFFQFYVNDYDGFIAYGKENIFILILILFFWPYYMAWIVFKFFFGIDGFEIGDPPAS